MMMSHRKRLATAFTFGAAITAATAAGAETGTFDLTLAGLTAGTLAYSGTEENGRYVAKGHVRSSPLARMVLDVEIDTTARGAVTGNDYRPAYFEATEVKDGKTTKLVQSYSGGVPSIERVPKKKKRNKHAADPESQQGTLDSLTTAYAMLRDRPRELACKLDIELFDGERRSGIRYARPSRARMAGSSATVNTGGWKATSPPR